MISSLLFILIMLAGFVAWLCAMQSRQLAEVLRHAKQQQQTLSTLAISLNELSENQIGTNARIGQLAADVIQRDVYQSADDRHQLAIKSAKQGKSQYELTQRHGLSLDEAALILSLHSPDIEACDRPVVKNANFVQQSVVDLV